MTKEPIIKSLHKRYKDSLLIRLYARVHEIALLLKHNKKLLNNLYLNEPSCSLPHDIKLDNFQGTGVAEAARGSLVHQTTIVDGSIENYEIIVPTQWNLSHGSDIEKGVATQAMIGSTSTEEASFIFRSFDVCSVCTTQ
jgi:hydrogenase large subunit